MARRTWLAVGALSIGLGGLAYARCRRDVRAAQARLSALGSQLVNTACGPVEYATSGDGPPVLIVHGSAGGFDAGLAAAQDLIGDGFRVIVPSRFGYLRSPLPADASPELQADAFAALLDTLGIDRIAVVGLSGGGTSAVQFALRYPARAAALILVSAPAPADDHTLPPPEWFLRVMFGSNGAFWLLVTGLRLWVHITRILPVAFKLPPDQAAMLDTALEAMLPVADRVNGLLFDQFVSDPAINGYPLEAINVPVLLMGAADDSLVKLADVRRMADLIPGAALFTVPEGGHMLVGHNAAVRARITAFIRQYSR